MRMLWITISPVRGKRGVVLVLNVVYGGMKREELGEKGRTDWLVGGLRR